MDNTRYKPATCASGGGQVLTIGCCCCTGPGIAPAWPAAVTPPGAGTPNGAVADGSMACHAHITPTREGTSNEVIGPPTAFLSSWTVQVRVHRLTCTNRTTAGDIHCYLTHTHKIGRPRTGTLQDDFIVVCCSSVLTALHVRLLCCCLCVLFVATPMSFTYSIATSSRHVERHDRGT